MSLPPLSSLKLPPLKIEKTEIKKIEEVKSALPPISLPPISLPALVPSPQKQASTLPPLAPSIAPPLPTSLAASIVPSVPKIQEKKEIKLAPAFVPVKKEEKKEEVKDLRQHIDTFFGVRNGIKGNPVENVNYTIETLTYMTSHNRADEMTKVIVEEMKSLGYNIFDVWENGAGIGGNTMSFAENANVRHITSYEILKDRREMLKRNLEMYNLLNKVTILEKEFDVKEVTCGSILFLDVPWLLNVAGHESKKEDYILENLKMGNKTLEEWAAGCSQCSLVVFKVPPGYKLKPIPNINVKELLLKNTLLLILHPVQSPKICKADMEKHLEKIRQQEQREKEEYVKWFNQLRLFLMNELLPRVTTSSTAIEKLVSPEAMKIWEVAFTHESFDPNQSKNYEEVELLGDNILSVSYVRFVMESYPEFNRSQLSELRTQFLSKGFQSQLSASLGLGRFIRSRFHTSKGILEDVLESTFGALLLVGDTVFKMGTGYGLCYNLTVNLYKDVPIEISNTLANPKTLIKEAMERLQMIQPKLKERVPETSEEDQYGNTIFTISWPPNGIAILKSLGINVTSPILAQAVDKTKKMASIAAYKMALNNITEMGITKEFIENFVRSKDLQMKELIPYINAIQERLKLENFADFYLSEHHMKGKVGGASTSKYILLIGVRPDGEKKVLAMTKEAVESVLLGKQEVLTAYANYQN